MFTRKLVINTLCEFGPILAFLVFYEFYNFQIATVAVIVAVIIALLVMWVVEHHLPLFALLSTVSLLLFGSISLFVSTPSIFILRDTLFDIFFGTVLSVSLFLGKPFLKTLFGHVFRITDRGWHILTRRWALFFYLLALVNEIIRQNLTPEEWVTAKVYMIVGTFSFGIYQFTLSRRERLPNANPWGLVH